MAELFELRPYQKKAVEAIRKKRIADKRLLKNKPDIQGSGRALVILPTGSGKTLVASEECRKEMEKPNGKMLILAHREKLLKQMKKELLLLNPYADIGIVGFGKKEWGHKITLGGVQTLWSKKGREERLARLHDITYCITDEAHHIMSSGYLLIHQAMPKAFYMGITATADRGDGKDASDFYGPPVYVKTIRELIEHKERYLCDLKTFVVKTRTVLRDTDIGKSGNDYVQKDLEYVVNCDERNQLIVESCINPELGGPDIPTVCFCSGKDHARELAATFNAYGITAQALLGDTPDDERDQIYDDFASGKLKVITNVEVCSEGWDADVRRVCLCSPTQVRSKHAQRIGRCTRNAPGKAYGYVLDFSDDVATHSLDPITLSDVFDMPVLNGELLTESSQKEREYRAQHEEDEKKRLEIVAEMATIADNLVNKQVDILGRMDWQRFKDSGYKAKINHSQLVLLPAKKNGEYYAGMEFRKNEHDEKVYELFNGNVPVSLSWGLSILEKKARQLQAEAYELVDPHASWKTRGITDGQARTLELFQRIGKIDRNIPVRLLTQGEASNIIQLHGGANTQPRKTQKKKASKKPEGMDAILEEMKPQKRKRTPSVEEVVRSDV